MMEPDFSATDRFSNQLIYLQSEIEPKISGQEPNEDEDDRLKAPFKSDAQWRADTASLSSHKDSLLSASSLPPATKSAAGTSASSSAVNDNRRIKKKKNNNNKAPKFSSGTKVNEDGTIRVPSGSGYRIMVPFPWRLHEILEEMEEKKLDWIVSWLPDGTGFQVHCQKSFSEIIIPMFFRHSRYKSFQRQLYLYGFRSRETHNMSRGAYFHPKFVKGDRYLCKDIVRCKTEAATTKKGKRTRAPKKSRHSNASTAPSQAQQQQQQQEPQSPTHQNYPTMASSSTPTPSSNPAAGCAWNQDTHILSFTQFSQHLLMYSEDIIGLFGPGFHP